VPGAVQRFFDGPAGPITLAGLFGDRVQLVVQHIMFGPEQDAACPTCTNFLNELSPGVLGRLRDCQTAYALVARAPLAKLEAYQASKGWRLPWYSSHGSDFNYDFQVTVDGPRGQVTYNYRAAPGLLQDQESAEMPGASCFLRDGRRDLPYLLGLCAGPRPHRPAVLLPRPDRAGPAGSLGRTQRPRTRPARLLAEPPGPLPVRASILPPPERGIPVPDPTTTALDLRYSDPAAVAATWADTLRVLGSAELFWISAARADGRPHVNRALTAAAVAHVIPVNSRGLQSRWDSVITLRALLMAIAVAGLAASAATY
jgi:hypothetical protein